MFPHRGVKSLHSFTGKTDPSSSAIAQKAQNPVGTGPGASGPWCIFPLHRTCRWLAVGSIPLSLLAPNPRPRIKSWGALLLNPQNRPEERLNFATNLQSPVRPRGGDRESLRCSPRGRRSAEGRRGLRRAPNRGQRRRERGRRLRGGFCEPCTAWVLLTEDAVDSSRNPEWMEVRIPISQDRRAGAEMLGSLPEATQLGSGRLGSEPGLGQCRDKRPGGKQREMGREKPKTIATALEPCYARPTGSSRRPVRRGRLPPASLLGMVRIRKAKSLGGAAYPEHPGPCLLRSPSPEGGP